MKRVAETVVSLHLVLLLVLLVALPQAMGGTQDTTTPIRHVIIIVQENHSFDNYFGTYPTANGTLVDATTSRLSSVNGIPMGVCLPLGGGGCATPRLTTSSSPANPVEGQTTYEDDYADNSSAFARTSGPQSMVYFDYHSVAAYWDYAEEYGLGESYFAAVLSTTTPNRLIMLAGDAPVSENYGPPPYFPYADTLMSQLDGAGVSWGYYDLVSAFGGPSGVYPLNYFSGMSQSSLADVRNISALAGELAGGSGLPAVSFVSILGDPALTEHPPYDPTKGELWVVSIVDRVMESSYWNSTAIFITWDEGGGYYDHVVPPAAFTIDHGFQSPLVGLGQRIPLLVISPYSKENYVSNTLMSHLSLTHFVEYNWRLEPLNSLVQSSNLPLDFFDFSQAPRTGVVLGGSGPYSDTKYPIPLQTTSGVSAPQHQQDQTMASRLLLPLLVIAVVISGAALTVVGVRRLRSRPTAS